MDDDDDLSLQLVIARFLGHFDFFVDETLPRVSEHYHGVEIMLFIILCTRKSPQTRWYRF